MNDEIAAGDVVLCTRGNDILKLFIVDEVRPDTIAGKAAYVSGEDGFTIIPLFDLQRVTDRTIVETVKRLLRDPENAL